MDDDPLGVIIGDGIDCVLNRSEVIFTFLANDDRSIGGQLWGEERCINEIFVISIMSKARFKYIEEKEKDEEDEEMRWMQH